MRIAIDTHTHSVASGHAYSTVEEMAEGARRAGLKGFVLTDHGPALAGLHDECFAPRAIDENTKALTAALRSPLVDAASVVATAKENGKAIEINAGSFRVRKGSEGNCLEIARLCTRMGALIVCGSDAHYWRDVGRLSEAIALLKKAGVPRELVINAQVRAFEDFIARRRAERGALLKAES
jgi:putative hydrolase